MTLNQTERRLLFEDAITVSMITVADHTTEDHYWSSKQSRFGAEQKARRWWEDRTAEEKEALITVVRKGLAYGYDNVEKWLPIATRLDQEGDRVTVMFQILHVDIDAMIETQERYTSKRLEEMSAEAIKLMSEE